MRRLIINPVGMPTSKIIKLIEDPNHDRGDMSETPFDGHIVTSWSNISKRKTLPESFIEEHFENLWNHGSLHLVLNTIDIDLLKKCFESFPRDKSKLRFSHALPTRKSYTKTSVLNDRARKWMLKITPDRLSIVFKSLLIHHSSPSKDRVYIPSVLHDSLLSDGDIMELREGGLLTDQQILQFGRINITPASAKTIIANTAIAPEWLSMHFSVSEKNLKTHYNGYMTWEDFLDVQDKFSKKRTFTNRYAPDLTSLPEDIKAELTFRGFEFI